CGGTRSPRRPGRRAAACSTGTGSWWPSPGAAWAPPTSWGGSGSSCPSPASILASPQTRSSSFCAGRATVSSLTTMKPTSSSGGRPRRSNRAMGAVRSGRVPGNRHENQLCPTINNPLPKGWTAHMGTDVVLVEGVRTAIGRFGGALSPLPASGLGAAVIREVLQRTGIEGAEIDEVILGCVGQIAEDAYIARTAAIKAGIPKEVPAFAVNRLCSSGLQSIVSAAHAIRLGEAEMVV